MKRVLISIICIMFLTSFVFAASITGSATTDTSNQNQVQVNSGEESTIQPNTSTQTRERARELNAYRIKNIKRVQNRLRANAEPSNCPGDCTCSGSTIKCRLEDGKREMTIRAGESGNTIMQVEKALMRTRIELYKAEGKVYGVFRNNETRVIKVLPDEVREKIRQRIKAKLEANESIELDEDGIYNVQARKQARFLGLIPVREKVITKIDSETGEITKIKTSWWGFLAKDVADDESSAGDNFTDAEAFE